MAALNDIIFDSGLNQFALLGDKLHILSSDPGLTWSNIAANTLGDKASPTISASADRPAGGREVTIDEILDGSVTGTGTATHWAIVDEGNTDILASGALAASQAVTSGNTFTLAAGSDWNIGIPDPA